MDRADSYTIGDKNASDLPDLQMVDYFDKAEGLLSRNDLGSGHTLTRADLARLMVDPRVKGEDAATLATLYHMAAFPLDPIGPHTLRPWGIRSADDIATVPVTNYQFQKLDGENSLLSAAIIRGNFNKADKNNNGVLSREEINADPLYSKLFKQVPELAGDLAASPVGLTRAMFADSTNPLNSIKMADIHQGKTSDCYFLTALQDAIVQNPAIIRDAIKANPDGSYTVTFKGDSQHPALPISIAVEKDQVAP